MKKIIIIFCLAFLGCVPPKYEKKEIPEEPLKFSNDPLLDSIYRDRYLDCLEKCKECD